MSRALTGQVASCGTFRATGRSTTGPSTEKRLRIPPELKGFRHGWIYLVGLLVAVALILAFFTLNPTAETPPFP